MGPASALVTIIGECGSSPLSSSSMTGRRLARMLRVRDPREVVLCDNVFAWDRDDFPMDEARETARMMIIDTMTVVLLGAKVSAAFGVRGLPWLSTAPFWRHPPPVGLLRCPHVLPREPDRAWVGTAWVFPHPSGRCRWWNDPVNREAAAALLRRIAHA